MTQKHPLRPDRLRQIPASFSWVDHRLIRNSLLQECDPPAWALYLFLVCVGDTRGLSYYSDTSVCRCLRVDLLTLGQARQQLIAAGLVAHRKPLYQVLDLEPGSDATDPGTRSAGGLSVAAILQKVMGGAQ